MQRFCNALKLLFRQRLTYLLKNLPVQGLDTYCRRFYLRIAKAYWFLLFWFRFYCINWILIFFDNFGHLTWLWRHHKNFEKNWFLPLVAPRRDFLPRKYFFQKVKVKRYRMTYHMTTLDDFCGKWSSWPLIAKNGRSFDHESRISF